MKGFYNFLKKTFPGLSLFSHPLVWLLVFNFFNIILFACIYWVFQDEFAFRNKVYVENKRKKTVWDILLLSTTIQAGVGITSVYPLTNGASCLLIIQQLLMIIGNILGMYSAHFIQKQ
jgi:hypothetical protein